ncbi:MAG: helix-turn-helix domain-containing protein [Clostridia bacterium]|nr:helix-turn-helix domain-containing protein [Clostridia bacterium]
MVELNVLELLKKKEKTKYWLFIQLDMTYTNFNNIVTNKTKSIKYSNIEKFCEILECEPNDLFKNTKVS